MYAKGVYASDDTSSGQCIRRPLISLLPCIMLSSSTGLLFSFRESSGCVAEHYRLMDFDYTIAISPPVADRAEYHL